MSNLEVSSITSARGLCVIWSLGRAERLREGYLQIISISQKDASALVGVLTNH